MSRVNLEQVRARNAIELGKGKKQSGQEGGNAISGMPALIMNNGLLAVLAFCIDKGKGHEKIGDAIARHLSDESLHLFNSNISTIRDLQKALVDKSNGSSDLLRRCTIEALAFLSYLKRLAD